MKQLESLDVWRVSHDLSALSYQLTMEQSLSRHFSLIDQIRRAGTSIPANIAEGYALSTRPQFVRCLRIALGSAAELFTHLKLLGRLKLVDDTRVLEAEQLCVRTIAMLVALLRKLS